MTGVRELECTAAPTDRSQLRFLRPVGGMPDEGESGRIGTGQLLRLITRQLFACPVTDDPDARPVPDIARELPTVDNGGISADGRTWRIRVRPGVRWDAQCAREVGAGDAVRGLKRTAHPLARPMRPYFGALIEGLADYYRRYDEEFGHWEAHAPALAQFSHLTRVPGLRAEGDTVVLRLTEPANDLIDLLATGYAAMAPREYDYYVPDSPELYRCNPACGPYRIARQLTPGGDFVLEPNPRWEPATDPIRRRTASRIDIVASPGDQPVDDATDFGVLSWDLPASAARFGGTGCSYYLSATPGGAAWSSAARRALSWAVDRAALAEAARSAGATGAAAQHGVLQPGDPGAAPAAGAAPDGGDPSTARHLLADAGLTPGSRLVLAVPAGSRPAVVAAALANMFVRYGVGVVTVSAGEPGADLTLHEWAPRWAGNANRDLLHRIWPADDGAGDPAGVATDALRALDPGTATTLWRRFDRLATADLRLVPLIVADWPRARADAVATGVARW
ncbi:ABC transporter substrate-binding protein [Micromonospora qiuiae]|uniref:ABC transporter substrate-binding protein n=1 Tax=Micromonospora qiuiae TaxID=502268 RepID=UPI00194E7778|nr:ABC transporter substrate-binding protein [Micromonospora qiuiae]